METPAAINFTFLLSGQDPWNDTHVISHFQWQIAEDCENMSDVRRSETEWMTLIPTMSLWSIVTKCEILSQVLNEKCLIKSFSWRGDNHAVQLSYLTDTFNWKIFTLVSCSCSSMTDYPYTIKTTGKWVFYTEDGTAKPANLLYESTAKYLKSWISKNYLRWKLFTVFERYSAQVKHVPPQHVGVLGKLVHVPLRLSVCREWSRLTLSGRYFSLLFSILRICWKKSLSNMIPKHVPSKIVIQDKAKNTQKSSMKK